MKIIAFLLFLLPMPARALDDDLFWKEGVNQGATLRSFQWKGRLYQNVRIANYDGRTVELTTGKETFSVPESSIPSLWRSAVHRRNWPAMRKESPPPAAEVAVSRVPTLPPAPSETPAKPDKVAEPEPPPIPEFTSYQQWGPARAAALAKAKGKAAAKWPDDYVRQLELVSAQMDAWDTLYPRPGKTSGDGSLRRASESSSKPYPKAEEPFRVRSVPLPSDAFTSDIIEIRTYDNRRVAARVEAVAEAEKLAQSTLPDPAKGLEREAEVKRLMALWDEANFEIGAPG